MTDSVLNELLRSMVTDVILTGFCDTDEKPLSFHPILQSVFIELGGRTLQLSCFGDTARITCEFVESARCSAVLDEGMVEARSSVRQLLLAAPDTENSIVAVAVWDPTQSLGRLECAALRLELENGQRLFFDALNFSGISIGGIEAEERWVLSVPHARIASHRREQ